MRRVSRLIAVSTASAMLFFGLTTSPAHAVANGTVDCTLGGTFTIANSIVTQHNSCAGHAEVPSGVTKIDFFAFGSSALASITLPNTLTTIDDYAFSDSRLSSITIPASVTRIGLGITSQTDTSSITVTEPNNSYTSDDGVLFNNDKSSLLIYPNRKPGLSYVIPAGVTAIGDEAFAGAQALAAVTIPSSVETIGESAFFGTTSLTSITIPANVRTIGESAFYANAGQATLTGVNFAAGSSLTTIGSQAFYGQNLLTSITIPASVTTIESSAFRDASGLTTLVIEPGGTPLTIDESAFYEATSLTSLTIPARVTALGQGAFQGSTNLASLNFAPASNLSAIPDFAFYDSAFSSITVPASVQTIGWRAFKGVMSLSTITFEAGSRLNFIGEEAFYEADITSLTLPETVATIGDGAFYGTSSLASVYFLGNEPSVGIDAFGATRSADPTAYVASGATGFISSGNPERWNGFIVSVGVHTATFNSNGGSIVSSKNFRSSIDTAPVAPTRTGFTFNGWSATDGGDAITFPYNPGVSADITLFAKWTLNPVSAPVPAPAANNPLTTSNSTPAASVTKASQALTKSIQFTANTRTLTKAHKAALRKSVKSSGLSAAFVVTGSAGKRPGVSDAHVRNFAKLRANAIKAYLVKLGVNESNIKIRLRITNQGIVPKTKLLAKNLTS